MRSPLPVLFCIALVVLLTNCGGDDDHSPSRTPDTSAPPSGTMPPITGSPIAESPRTVGELADRIAAAWTGVRSFRTTFAVRSDASPATQADTDGTPAAFASPTIHDTVILPDRKHRVIIVDASHVLEVIVVADRVFVRGSLSQSFAPEHADATTWIEIVEVAAAAPSPLGINLADLTRPVPVPYSALPPEVRERTLAAAGEVTVAGRGCHAYQAADMTTTGEAITVTIALGDDDLPCSIETRAGGTTSLTTYDAFNEPLSIEPPLDATPVASPVA